MTREAVAGEASTAGSPPSTRSCAPSRTPAGSGAATSSTGSVPRSSPWPAPSSGCARSASRRGAADGRPCSSPQPIRPIRTARRSPWPRRGEDDRRPLPARRRRLCRHWSTGWPCCISIAAAARSRSCPAGDDPEIGETAARALGALVEDGRLRELVITKVDGGPIAEFAVPGAAARRPGSWPATAGSSCAGAAIAPERRRRARDGASVGPERRARRPGSGSLTAMPEGDTLHRTAAGLRAAPRRTDRRRRARPGGRPAGPADRRRGDHERGGDRQEPPDPVRQRARAADPHADERLVAPLPAGRALAPAAGAGAARARGPGRGRGLLRRPGHRAVRDPGRGDPPDDRAAWAGPPRRPIGCGAGRGGIRRLRDPARAGTTISTALLDQRALAGIGNIWRNETLFHERVDPWARVGDLDDATIRRLIETAHRLLRASVDATLGPVADAGLRPRRPAVPALRDAHPVGGAGPGRHADDVLVPDLPAAAREHELVDRRRSAPATPRSAGRASSRSVADAGARPSSRCRVASEHLDRFGNGETDPTDLVRRSFAFLLAREPPSSILRAVRPADDRPLLPRVRGNDHGDARPRRRLSYSGGSAGAVHRGTGRRTAGSTVVTSAVSPIVYLVDDGDPLRMTRKPPSERFGPAGG